MPERNLAEISAKINAILETLDSLEDRVRVLQSSMALYGGGVLAQPSASHPAAGEVVATPSPNVTEQQFFKDKNPQSQVEKLAVAARYRELHMGADTHSKEEIERFFMAAHESFVGNYGRDMGNARNRGFFTKGNKRDAARLATYGQEFVNALPDRDVASALPTPKKQPKKKKASKKANG